MVGLAGALVLNIGTLSRAWVDAMLIAGRAANERGDAGRARPGRRRRDGVPHRDGAADPRRGRRRGAARQRRRGRDARRRRGGGARRRVDRRRRRPGRAGARRRRDRSASSRRSPARSTTSRTATRSLAIANGHPLLASITGTGCMSSAITGCFLAVADDAVRGGRRGARRVRRRGRGRGARGARAPARSTSALYDALAALDPGDARRAGEDQRRMRVHAHRRATSRRRDAAVEAGATVVQLRVKRADGRGRRARATRASRALGVDVRRQRRRRRGDRARRRRRPSRPGRRRAPSARAAPGCCSAARRDDAASRRSRRDARLPRRRPDLGDAVEGRRRAADRARRARAHLPSRSPSRWSRSAAIDASNAAACIRAGAAGVAVIRAATDPALRGGRR